MMAVVIKDETYKSIVRVLQHLSLGAGISMNFAEKLVGEVRSRVEVEEGDELRQNDGKWVRSWIEKEGREKEYDRSAES